MRVVFQICSYRGNEAMDECKKEIEKIERSIISPGTKVTVNV